MGKTEALWKFLCSETQSPSLQLTAFCSFIKVKYKSNEKTPTLFLPEFSPLWSSMEIRTVQSVGMTSPRSPSTFHQPNLVVPIPESLGGWGGFHVKLSHRDSSGSHLRGKHGGWVDHRGRSHL